MALLMWVGLLCLVVVASWSMTKAFRRVAIVRQLVDVPNERSSHATATPRGGGMAIVLTTLLALQILGGAGMLPWTTVWSLLGAGSAVAYVGFLDDRGHVAARWRLIVHFAAASWVLIATKGIPQIVSVGFEWSWLGYVVAVLYLVWMLNLTNFMDGIDGIAGIETITVCVSGALLSRNTSTAAELWILPAILACATLGFLAWNWPPAKIFLGDVGSGFLGLTMAIFSLQAGSVDRRLFWSWVVLVGVFVVDATVTLIWRLARGERVYKAHRTHAYQHAATQRRSHKQVTLAVGMINLCWLLPMAWMVSTGRIDGRLGVLIAYSPLALVAVRLGAGRPSSA